jgi:antitoxin ParD1/3/4
MPTRRVTLTDHFDKFAARLVKSGRFGNVSEVVQKGLRLLEQREAEDKARLKRLKAGVPGSIDSADWF